MKSTEQKKWKLMQLYIILYFSLTIGKNINLTSPTKLTQKLCQLKTILVGQIHRICFFCIYRLLEVNTLSKLFSVS